MGLFVVFCNKFSRREDFPVPGDEIDGGGFLAIRVHPESGDPNSEPRFFADFAFAWGSSACFSIFAIFPVLLSAERAGIARLIPTR
jgi:hypothetical protein